MNILAAFAWFAMTGRIILLAAERYFLKKLDRFDSFAVSSLFFLVAAILLIPSFIFIEEPISLDLFFQGKNALISALFYSIGLYSYVKAISVEDTVLIAPLYNSSSLWIFIFGFVFLDENVTPLRVLGGILIFIGVFLLYKGNLHDKIQAIMNSQGSLYMLAGSVFIAIGRTIDAFSVRSADPIFFAFLMNFYLGLYLLFVTIILGKAKYIPQIFKEEPVNLFWAAFSNGWAYLFLLIALLEIDLSIAEPLSLLSLLLTALLGKYLLGERLKERINGTMIIIFGAFMLFY